MKTTKQLSSYYDLSQPLSAQTVVFPGDPAFQTEAVSALAKGEPFQSSRLQLSSHAGTHIDYPAHVIQGAKTSSDFSIRHHIGSGLIIEVPYYEKSITKNFVLNQVLLKNDIVFFKTRQTEHTTAEGFSEDYVYIEPDAAQILLRKEVKIVGIDSISVDRYGATKLPVHHLLLGENVLIVEGLELSAVPLGRHKISIVPLNIPGMDGLPARVIARVTS